jgi:hypothetical protein
MPQLIRIACQSGQCGYFKCPYHANVMNTLEHTNTAIVGIPSPPWPKRH